MVPYKLFLAKIIRRFFWLSLLLITSGVSIGNAQSIEQAGASLYPNNHGKGNPGETVIYTHTLSNVGTGTDTFDLTAVSSEGWFISVSPDVVTLNGQQETTILVTVVVNPNAHQGDVDVTTVKATSQNSPGTSATATDTTVVPIPMFLPVVMYNAGQPAPDCQLDIPSPANPPGIDLVVTAISLTPGSPQVGQAATVRVTVKNQGMTAVSSGNNFLIDFYDDPVPEPPGPLQPGDMYWGAQGGDFTAGQSLTFESAITFNSSGLHRLYAQVDTDQVVAESNENNNIYGCLGVLVN
ncbi:MAG: CARDB domain-containing protein [Candidatus Promineifilaceae bacterium]